jgi:tRNA-binding protein
MTDLISYDYFKKLDLRVGKIQEAVKVDGSDKLYRLKVDTGGDEPIQIISGLVDYYKEEELLGKKIVVVVNLEPAKIRGEMSNGMLLCAVDEAQNECVLLTTDKEIKPGCLVS